MINRLSDSGVVGIIKLTKHDNIRIALIFLVHDQAVWVPHHVV